VGFYTNGKVNNMTSLVVSIGEDSEVIAAVASPGDPDLLMPNAYSDPSDFASVDVMQEPPPFGAVPAHRKCGIVITGMKPGRTTVTTETILRATAPTIATLQVDVNDLLDPNVDLYYLGRYLVWRRTLPASAAGSNYLLFSASSGNFAFASAQNQPDNGPVPEGLYRFLAKLDPKQSSVQLANDALPKEGGPDGLISNTRQGIQYLPVGGNGNVFWNWGSKRVRLEPITALSSARGGFYLHNSTKGYTHGCIELGKSIESRPRDFFGLLEEHAVTASKQFLTLKVKYRTPDTSTRGDTKL
jgi:hypothetical protein